MKNIGIHKLLLSLLGMHLTCGLYAKSPVLVSDNYTPPSTPELYDEKEPLVPAYIRVKKYKSHAYAGLGVGFGTGNQLGSKASSIASWNIVAEGGYVKAVTSWTRVDFGVEFFNGKVGSSTTDIPIDYAGLVKIGYGYNVSENLYALIRIGYGLAAGRSSISGGNHKSVNGGLWQLGFQLIVPTESSFDVLGGFFLSQYSFGDRGTYNTYEGRLGMRLRI